MSGILPALPPYHLHRTLTCGQVFRWTADGDTAAGVFAGRMVRLTQRDGAIEVEGLRSADGMSAFGRYLGVDQDLAHIERTLAADGMLRRILRSTSGIALIRQDPWECLISFVISAFNNIPKIEMTLDRLCRRFGDALAEGSWAFPRPEHLAAASLRELRGCLLGYRAPYVRDIARRVEDGRFDLRLPAAAPYGDARAMLLRLPGVGDKVADCVLLFAYGKGEAFPVDVWVKRAVERLYFGGRPKAVRDIQGFARERFGRLAGYAQQHLYSNERARKRRVRV